MNKKKLSPDEKAHRVAATTKLLAVVFGVLIIGLFFLIGVNVFRYANSDGESAEGSSPAADTSAPFITTAPLMMTESETTAGETEISGYAETSEELIMAVLNAFGAHDKETFNAYAFKTNKYSSVYEKFCRKVSDTVDYKADRTHEDFDVYIMSSGNWHTFAAFLKEDSNTEITISTEFDYEKEMYNIVNIDVCTISYKTATDEPHTMLDFSEIKED